MPGAQFGFGSVTPGWLLAALVGSFWLSLLVAAVLAKPILKLLLAMKSRQTVSQYAPEGHQVKQGTPTMGGLIIAAGVIPGLALAAHFISASQSADEASTIPNLPLIGLVLFVLFALIGFVDDFVVPRLIPGKRGLGWKQKILMQVVAAVAGGAMLYGSNLVGVAGAVFLILFFSNAYNFSDGLDGLAGSLLVLLGGGLAAIAWFASGRVTVACALMPMVAAAIPFLFLNAPPAKVFMGDVGSLAIGVVLGLAAMALIAPPASMSGQWIFWNASQIDFQPGSRGAFTLHPLETVAVLVASLVMVAELVPVPLQILSVKLRKKKLFPYTPIHHAFEKAGWPETHVVWAFALTQLVLCALAVSIMSASGSSTMAGSMKFDLVPSQRGP